MSPGRRSGLVLPRRLEVLVIRTAQPQLPSVLVICHLPVASFLNCRFIAAAYLLNRHACVFSRLTTGVLKPFGIFEPGHSRVGWGGGVPGTVGSEQRSWPHPLDARSPPVWQPQMSPDAVWGQDRLRLRKASYNNLPCIRAVSTLLCHTFFFCFFSQFPIYLSALFLMCWYIESLQVYCQICLFL